MPRLHVVIEGRVQGVGFRYTMSHEAQALRLSGWARNRDDGAVEAEFEGEREALEQMLDWCETGPAFANVANVEAHWEEGGAAKYSGFRIRG